MTTPRPSLLLTAGPRAAEEVLGAEISRELVAGPAGLAALGRPLVVIVPSGSLRRHVAAMLTARSGRPLLGVRVVTLFAAAREILTRAGEVPGRGGELLLPVLVRRLAQEVPALGGPLGGLEDGYRSAVGTVRDLLDAGLEPGDLTAAAREAVAEDVGGWENEEAERAEGLVALAAAVARALRALNAPLARAEALRRARELLSRQDGAALPARRVWIHGFADATGLASELLAALVTHAGATVILDQPPDPADATGARRERAFGLRLAERLRGAGANPVAVSFAATAPEVFLFQAPDPEGEAREVARRLRGLIDAGAAPERLAVVARDLGPWVLPLRRWLPRFGVPFSGAGALGPLTPAGRRARAVLGLLSARERTPVDRFLDAHGRLLPLARVELRLALHGVGAGRLGDVAGLDPAVFGTGQFALPLRQGLTPREPAEGDDESAPERATRRHVAVDRLHRAVASARAVLTRLRDWPDPAPVRTHLAQWENLWRHELATAADEDLGPLRTATERLRQELPGELVVQYREWTLLFEAALGDSGREPLGGGGGGVAVLQALEARGRTFDELFVLGLQRGVFPRTIEEDPLLPDSQRVKLARVLPDVPIKTRGFDEERHLFATLAQAAPRVTWSWSAANEDGKPRPPSPWIERLLALRPALRERVEKLAPWASRSPVSPSETPRPAREIAVLAGLYDGREAFAAALPQALADAREGVLPPGLASAHLAALAEFDPDLTSADGRRRAVSLGPHLGLMAAPGSPAPAVTTLEGLATCPWQTFLERVLRLAPAPDPLLVLPGLSPLLVGTVIHGTLAAIVAAHVPPAASLTEARQREPQEVPWPAPQELAGWVLREARAALASGGVLLPGLARALAATVMPWLEVAQRLDWGSAEEPLAVLAAEVEGRVAVLDGGGRRRELPFRADRVDRLDQRQVPVARGAAPLRLTDYKSGKPFSTVASPIKRAERFQQQIATGQRLQAMAYALAAGAGGEGRYLFLAPTLADELRPVIARDTPATTEPFQAAVAATLNAWDHGAFLPRLVRADRDEEPTRCAVCEVHEACRRGDSGARLRLRRWAAGREQGQLTELGTAAERAAWDVWRLPLAEGT